MNHFAEQESIHDHDNQRADGESAQGYGQGRGWNELGVHRPQSYTARVRTGKALSKRGLLDYSGGDCDLTGAGEVMAKHLNTIPPIRSSAPRALERMEFDEPHQRHPEGGHLYAEHDVLRRQAEIAKGYRKALNAMQGVKPITVN